MASFWERAAYSDDPMLSLYNSFCDFSNFPFWFFGQDMYSDLSSSRSLLNCYII